MHKLPADGGMSMNPNLTSTVSDFSKGRTERSNNKLSLRTLVPNLIARIRLWLGKLVSFAFPRVLMIFVVGFAAGIAWQSYGSEVRKTIANWSPHLAWVAPALAPAGTSAERLKATSLALAAARQSFDKLTTEIGKLQVADIPDTRPGPRRAGQRWFLDTSFCTVAQRRSRQWHAENPPYEKRKHLITAKIAGGLKAAPWLRLSGW
jgi:hypothetical protein